MLREAPPQFNLDHRTQLLRVGAVVLAQEFRNAREDRAGFIRVEDHLLKVFEKMSADELVKSSVEELAKRFGCSRRHLTRLFRRYFGVSVAGLRMELRLLKAVSLLRDPNAKVIQVAEQCGFNHLGLFNTCFKRRFNTSPGQWRKERAQPADTPGGPATGEHSALALFDSLMRPSAARVDTRAEPVAAPP